MAKVYGIDLGTTYSCIAEVESGKAQMVNLPAADNYSLFPSVVSFLKTEEGETVKVGQNAKDDLQDEENHDNVCSFVKRQMGTKTKFSFWGLERKPEEISAIILKGLVEASQRDDVKDVVITCPAYFGLNERHATKDAGELANLNVLAVLNEPTAAAIAYGVDLNEEKTILVYDLGGGTFDTTVIHVKDNEIKVVATDGNHHLGGVDWDEAIQNYVINQYANETGISVDEIKRDYLLTARLVLETEVCKKKLSKLPYYNIAIHNKIIKISRETFEELTKDKLQQTIDLTKKVMKMAADKGYDKIDQILLVGGSTLMPQVEKRLREEFKSIEISKKKNPHEAVALGAALYAQIMQDIKVSDSMSDPDSTPVLYGPNPDPIKLPPSLVINNIVTKSYALEHVDPKDKQKTIITNIIFKNQDVPLETSRIVYTLYANQKTVSLKIWENDLEENQRDNNRVEKEDQIKIIIDGELGPLPDNLPENSKIQLTLKIDSEGIMSLDATDLKGGVTTHLEAKLVNALSEEEKKEIDKRLNSIVLDVE